MTHGGIASRLPTLSLTLALSLSLSLSLTLTLTLTSCRKHSARRSAACYPLPLACCAHGPGGALEARPPTLAPSLALALTLARTLALALTLTLTPQPQPYL